MKKVLLASTALIAFGAVSAQAAEPVKLALGGYMIENVGYAENGESKGNPAAFSKTDVQSDVNVNFVGSSKLDNGITVAVEVDTFGSQRKDSRSAIGAKGAGAANGNVKRSFLTVSGAFGAGIIGEREDALYIVHNAAPDVGANGLQDGTWHQWVVPPSNHRLLNTTSTSRYDNRANKISYVTPSFYGVAAAASYVPNIQQSMAGHTTIQPNTDTLPAAGLTSGMASGADFTGDLYGAGLAFNNTFSGVSIKADAGIGQANVASLRVYQGGLQVGYAGFTVGGSILNRHVESHANANVTGLGYVGNAITKTAAYAGQSFDAGVSYATGPYAVSLGFFHDTSKDDGSMALPGGGVGNGGGADSTDVWTLSGAYTMGPGVAWKSSVSTVDYKDGNNSSTTPAAANARSGFAVVTGVRVDF